MTIRQLPAGAEIDVALQEQVLSKAVVRAADHLALTNRLLAEVLGLSEPTISRLRRGRYRLQRGAKPFELAQLLLRLFRSLDAITGGDDEASRSWLEERQPRPRRAPDRPDPQHCGPCRCRRLPGFPARYRLRGRPT